jgi:N-acetylglucosamine-6-phosphate deacetylase
VEAGRGLVKIWCIAPERDGIDAFVAAAKGGVVFSAAHSEAAPWQVFRFVDDGLVLQTHHTNATGVKSGGGMRGAGVDEAVLLNDDIYAELICDSMAVHVKPDMLRLALKVKGRDRIILISDSSEFDGQPLEAGGPPDLNFDSEGGLAGSKLTLDRACANMMKHTGAGICDVFRFASLNPARLLGMQGEIGCIRRGARANLVIVDDMVNVKKVIFEGTPVAP